MEMEELKRADVITAGFPCQDISFAGKGAGLQGERSGLWWQVRRTIRMVRPSIALLENVAALLNRGMGSVLGSLARIGYDTEWHCIPASAVGAPHRRKRVWIVAHADQPRGGNCKESNQKADRQPGTHTDIPLSQGVFTDNRSKRGQRFFPQQVQRQQAFSWCKDVRGVEDWFRLPNIPEPLVRRNSNGVSERLHALGNSIVPQIVELIGEEIMKDLTHPTEKEKI